MRHVSPCPITRRTMLKTAAFGLAAALLPFSRRPAFAAQGKTLILFYSWSGNTRVLARQIHQRLGGDMAEIVPVTAYPADYDECTDLAKRELQNNVFPPIRPVASNVSGYDVILLGSPNWWASWAGPVRTFLRGNNLAGKTVLPFSTHGGGGWQNMLTDLKKFCPDARIQAGLTVSGSRAGSAGSQVDEWLKDAGLTA